MSRVSDETLWREHLEPWAHVSDAGASDGLKLARDLFDCRAPPPPAAADRGVPGQVTEEMVNAAWTKFEELNDGGGVYRDAMKFAIIAALAVGPKNEALEVVLKCFDEPMEIWPTGWREKYPALTTPSVEVIRSRIKAFVARAALATAPKAEDVRREAIEQCAKVVKAFPKTVRRTVTIREHDDLTSMGMSIRVPEEKVRMDCPTERDDLVEAIRELAR